MKMDKAKVENCIAKTRAFYDTKAVGCALLKVKNIATLPSPALSLTDYTFPDDVYKYLDARAQCTIERLAQRAELADDTVPAEGPWYGIAEHTAFLGGRVDYESDTSWHYAMLDAPGELEKLAMDENNPVFRMVNGGIAYLREKYSDYFHRSARRSRDTACAARPARWRWQTRCAATTFSTISMKSRRT